MPKLIIGGGGDVEEIRELKYKVVDICERGVKFTSEAEVSRFEPSSKIEAQVTFSDGDLLVINGEVLRCSNNQVVINPSKDIPFSRILQEQRFVQNLRQLGIY